MKRNHRSSIQLDIWIGVVIKQVEYVTFWVKMICLNDFLTGLYFVLGQSVQKYVIVLKVI